MDTKRPLRLRVLLVEIVSNLKYLGKFLRHSVLDPMGIEYIGTFLEQNGYSVSIRQISDASEGEIKRLENKTDIIGLSVLTPTYHTALDLAKKFKKNIPRIMTILGGYHPSSCPEIVEDENIDFVVIGEGERTFVELLDTLSSNGDITKVKGIAYWDGGLRINEPRERIENLDELPFPLRDKEILKECKIGGLSYPPPSQQESVCQITYSRGCPYNCIFCNSPQLWGKQVRWRSAKNLVNEIEYLQREFGTNMVFFTDLTFDLNKTKVYELCAEIKNRGIDINWFPMCRVDHIDKDLLIAMKDVGCTKISYGIDAVCNATLSKIKPRQNVNFNKIKLALELTSNVGIIVRAYVMIGYPWEDKKSLQETKKILKTLPVDDLRISFLTPFPGTLLYEEFKREGLLLTEDFSRYTSEEPIIKVKNLAPQELIDAREKIFKEFYQSKEYEMRKRNKINKFPHLKHSYDEFFDFLHHHSILL